MAYSSAFFQSVENPQNDVNVCINSAPDKTIEENRYIHFSAQCILFCGQQHLAFRGMVDLDIMVIRKFLSINEAIQLAKHNSIINAQLERPKLK